MALFVNLPVLAQKIYTKNGHISFFSTSPLEDITAKNNEVMSVINQQTGEIQFSVLIKSFRFKKSLMEQHFNEDYLESDKFPKAIFKGIIADISRVNFGTDGTYPVSVTGELTIHGITNKLSSKGDIMVKNGVATAQSTFNINLADYKITIPSLVRNNIAKTIAITVSCFYNQKM
jgi:polyisoprenoid-binding protein YceI